MAVRSGCHGSRCQRLGALWAELIAIQIDLWDEQTAPSEGQFYWGWKGRKSLLQNVDKLVEVTRMASMAVMPPRPGMPASF